MSDKAKEPNPANAKSECPACRACKSNHIYCRFKECPQYMEWLHMQWKNIQMKWSRE